VLPYGSSLLQRQGVYKGAMNVIRNRPDGGESSRYHLPKWEILDAGE